MEKHSISGQGFSRLQIAMILMVLAMSLACGLLATCQRQPELVVYTSVDQVYSEPLLRQFERQSGIRVKAVYDIEAAKSVGLANRLIAEASNPQADIFWNGEILQTLALQAEGVLATSSYDPTGTLPAHFVDPGRQWFGFGGRARVLIVNTRMVAPADCPQTLSEIASHPLVLKAGIAYPLFGTTATQAAALYATWGEAKAKAFYSDLQQSGIQVLEGNSVVKDAVSQGSLAFGLTDTDDALGELAKNPDLAVVLLDQEAGGLGTLVIPNTVARIQGGPNPEAAERFIAFLLQKETEQQLVDSGWIQIPVLPGVRPAPELPATDIRVMPVDFSQVYAVYEQSKADMSQIFIR